MIQSLRYANRISVSKTVKTDKFPIAFAGRQPIRGDKAGDHPACSCRSLERLGPLFATENALMINENVREPIGDKPGMEVLSVVVVAAGMAYE
jgi:hypothetical protein